MLSAFVEALIPVIIENLPAIEGAFGRAVYLVELDRILHTLADATLAVQAMKQRLADLMEQNDAAVEAARKPPNKDGGK